ncbi:MAG: S-methyl-5-thioribose-1-phosphate isomerase [Deltaproteobacteria bacterium]|nr:S-methyl-5-thioribose-1-phosphate isomerase [Deltaproteobacteria bacterium]
MNEYLSPLEWRAGRLHLLDQRLLPAVETWLAYDDEAGVAAAIRDMVVRGAPAIGCVAAFGVVLGLRRGRPLDEVVATLRATRPTAVNLFWALERMRRVVLAGADPEAEALAIWQDDIDRCRRIGRAGAALIPDGATVLTHCNAGALATGGYGTALGVVRAARAAGKRVQVLADETRPVLQGARLTAWELQRDGIPVTVITDSMAAHFFAQGAITCAVVGADRIARNGDFANKIGTYGVAVLCHAHGVPFYCAAPLSTVDLGTPDGTGIPIEERAPAEVTHVREIQLCPAGISVRNPAFDVTPARLVAAIITEEGVVRPPFGPALAAAGAAVGAAVGAAAAAAASGDYPPKNA